MSYVPRLSEMFSIYYSFIPEYLRPLRDFNAVAIFYLTCMALSYIRFEASWWFNAATVYAICYVLIYCISNMKLGFATFCQIIFSSITATINIHYLSLLYVLIEWFVLFTLVVLIYILLLIKIDVFKIINKPRFWFIKELICVVLYGPLIAFIDMLMLVGLFRDTKNLLEVEASEIFAERVRIMTYKPIKTAYNK